MFPVEAIRRVSADAAKPSASQECARIGLGSLMLLAGVGHLTFARKEFQVAVPDWLAMDKDTVVVASGVAEVALGAAALTLPKQRAAVGAALAAFFVAVFPGNVHMYVERQDAVGLDTDGKRLARLFGQPLLVWAALHMGGFRRR